MESLKASSELGQATPSPSRLRFLIACITLNGYGIQSWGSYDKDFKGDS